MEAQLIQRIRDRQREIADGLCVSPVEDFARYKQRVGEYLGLQAALDELNDLLRNDEVDPDR